MDDKDRLNALEVALNNETREREFYLKNAQRTSNRLGKAMFERIALDELEHYNRLKELHRTWEKQEKWPESVPLTVNNTNIKDILLNTIKDLDKAAKADSGDLDAIKTAVEFENRGTKFYAELRDASTDPKEKEFFNLLSVIEREHYMSLRDAEEYLTSPDTWFIKVEHHSFDGA
ncbi:MAG TPA: ferritin family protein [Syntrophorhabdaceae bacterium]|nr:ferritin family protein [Syntrophorhabdaceae bacterium]